MGTTTVQTQFQNVPVSKSGVIVVDTEKLMKQSSIGSTSKKNKKKKNKNKQLEKVPDNIVQHNKDSDVKPAMVTLKNPIFHTLQTKLNDKNDLPIIPYDERASITQGENGMVTIRRPRCLQLSGENDSPMTDFLNEFKPAIGSKTSPLRRGIPKDVETKSKYPRSNSHADLSKKHTWLKNACDINFEQKSDYNIYNGINPGSNVRATVLENKNNLSPHDILWGLPGIEITKVNKNATNSNLEKKSCLTADVSIIPTRNSSTTGEKFNFDKDDWQFGNFSVILY